MVFISFSSGHRWSDKSIITVSGNHGNNINNGQQKSHFTPEALSHADDLNCRRHLNNFKIMKNEHENLVGHVSTVCL